MDISEGGCVPIPTCPPDYEPEVRMPERFDGEEDIADVYKVICIPKVCPERYHQVFGERYCS